MNNFDKRFDRMSRNHDRMMGGIFGLGVVMMLIYFAVIGFGVWVIVQLLQHFGVI